MSSPPPGTSPAPTTPAIPPPTNTTSPPPAAAAPPPTTPASPPPLDSSPPAPVTPVSSPPAPETPSPATSPPAPPTSTTTPPPPSTTSSPPAPPTSRNSPPSPAGRSPAAPQPPRSAPITLRRRRRIIHLGFLPEWWSTMAAKRTTACRPFRRNATTKTHSAAARPTTPITHCPTFTPAPPPPPPFSSGGSGSNYSGGSNALPPPSPGMSLGFSKSTFTCEELAMATDGFSEANLLGQGGFGYVHRGVLPNGKEVAVKQLKTGSGQGEREFQAEVEIISRVHHKHLVSLVGYCISGAQRLLVYEFVPNNTLEFHLHGKGHVCMGMDPTFERGKNRPVMEFPTRLRIALGAAKGLAYLHEDCHPKIIHRDIKAANILLDFNFEAKVADFGLAKITSDVATHVSTRVMGTFGYLAPEYAASGKLSDKSDVFSFGVMLLELITGRRPVDSAQTFMDDSLVDWARPLLTRAMDDGNFDSIADSRLQRDYNHSEMARMVSCAAACVRHSARRRPRMSQVVRALEGDVSLSDLTEGIRAGQGSAYGSHGSSDYDTAQYNEDMVKFRKMALGTQEYASSEYSRPTSEYGLYPSGSSSEAQNTREMEMGKYRRDGHDGF
ncbi:hypothetical protein OSB04_031331 [Centaurea solstitialis]|uniref:non-specific serine/threonine protein kinase n=1 Tax=Centaurea solstitialis TaxID=347529 RepID=A0AA38SUG8_9ASTR|nr:hypothetical protein OSB04_031331 [Centaurea solstitialis]